MARRPKPWWWSQAGEWCVTIGGKRHRLGPEKEAAETRFHNLMAKPELRVPSNTVIAIIELFLDWTQKHREHETYLWYKKHLQGFKDSLNPQLLTVDRLKAHHVEAWVDAHEWGDSYRRGAMTAVARCLNWSFKKGHIENNPIYKRLEKPAAGKREVVLSPAQFKKLLKHLEGDLRDLVFTAWETGCRPQEVTRVEAQYVDLRNGRWVFPVKQSKGKKKERVVYLSKAALTITKRLMGRFPTGPIFRNGENPWTRFEMSRAFGRLKEIVGMHYRLYDMRHSFITNGLKNGVDPITMQHLVGHTDLAMISKIYAHVSQDVKHMRKSAERVTAGA
jgi:integrase